MPDGFWPYALLASPVAVELVRRLIRWFDRRGENVTKALQDTNATLDADAKVITNMKTLVELERSSADRARQERAAAITERDHEHEMRVTAETALARERSLVDALTRRVSDLEAKEGAGG